MGQMKRLQAVQNAAAPLVSTTHRRDHSMSLLRNLHWLPVGQRVIFTTAVLVCKCIHGVAPVYLQEICTQVDSIRGRPRLRSASTGCIQLVLPEMDMGPFFFTQPNPSTYGPNPTHDASTRTQPTHHTPT